MRWSGPAFVACFVAAAVVYGSGAGRSAAEIAAYYASSGDRARQIAGFGILLAGVLCLLLFVAELPGTVPLVSGAAAAVLLTAANALWAGSAFTAHLEGASHVDANTHLMLEDTGFALFVASAACAIPLVADVSRRGPRWFTLLGVVAVVGLATSYWYFPWAAFLVWVIAAARVRR